MDTNLGIEGPVQASGVNTKRRMANLAEIEKTLRNTVAAAPSHRDTEEVFERLDGQLAFFMKTKPTFAN
ncbi:hypothetical protein N7475_006820 [Penicillium sp. IBT 31633x]|nr:hypothetical protein N7475_006820 [Penicillium sp. IBT 31633x]